MSTPKPPKIPLDFEPASTKQAFFLVLTQLAIYMAIGFFVPVYLLADNILAWPESGFQTFLAVMIIMLGALGIGSTVPRLIDPTIPVRWISGLQVNPYSAGQEVYGERYYKRYSRRQILAFGVACAMVYGLGLWILSI